MAALVLSLLPLAALGKAPSLAQLATLAPWLLLAAAGFLIPVMSGIYWVPAASTPAAWASCSRSRR